MGDELQKEQSRECKSKRIQEMHRRVCQIKASEKAEVKYMQTWEEKNKNKVDKGFELVYWKLSYRRKFIRTLWIIPWAIVSLIFIQIVGKNYKYTILAGIIYLVILPIQAIYNYKKWMKEEMK